MLEAQNKAMHGQRPKCSLCNGTGEVDVIDRDKVSRGIASNRDKMKMRCPLCGGKGTSGLRTT